MKAMYRIILSAAAAILLAASCQHNEHPIGLPSGEEVSVSISAVLPGDGGAVVKSAEDPGDGTMVNRCILEVYLIDGNNAAALYGSREIVKVENFKASFDDLNLITGQKYRFVLWADYVDNQETVEGLAADKFYNTDAEGVGLKNVTIKDVTAYAGNDDQRDAFFYHSEDVVTVTGPADYTLQLKRPFGQLNIITTDYGLIPEDHNGLLPAKVQLTYKNIPTGINLLTGELLTTDTDGSVTTQEVAGTAVDIAGPAVEGNDDAKQLSFDYILAPATGQHVINELKMSFLNSDGNATGITAYTFESLPVQRNYRTNVSGALLTDRAGLSIEVKPDFDETVTVAEQAETIEAAQLAINAGMNDIEFTKAVNGTITLPEGSETYNISFNEGVDGDITIQGDTYTGHLYIENHGVQSEHTLTIALPEGSATLDFGAWSSVSVSTADNTFILGEDVTISGTLTVNKGNVEIYGRVENIEFRDENSLVTVFTVYDAESLRYAASLVAQNRCAKIVLGADIDLKGSAENPWEPIGSGLGDGVSSSFVFKEFDGNCKVISNLYVHNHKAISGKPGFHYAGLFYTFSGTIKDLTIKKAYVYGSRSSVLVGRFDGGIIENCNIYDSEVYGVQKNAMIAGFINNTALDVTIRGFVVRNGVIKTIPPADNGNATNFQSGGISGFLYSYNRNILIQDNVVDNISIPDADRTATGSSAECVSHDFVGNLLNNSSIDCSNYTVEFKNNKILNCNNDLPKNPVCTEFIGWYYSNALSPKIIVDGKQLNY